MARNWYTGKIEIKTKEEIMTRRIKALQRDHNKLVDKYYRLQVYCEKNGIDFYVTGFAFDKSELEFHVNDKS